jgi:dGTPase
LLGLIKYPNYLPQLNQPPQEQNSVSHRQVKASLWHPPKGLYECDKESFEWLLEGFSNHDIQRFMQFNTAHKNHHKTVFKSFDCSIMELADDIAYGIHDLEDAIVMGIVNQSQFNQEIVDPLLTLDIDWMNQNIVALSEKLFSQHHHERKDAIGALVNCFITNIQITQITPEFEQDLLKYNAVFNAPFDQALSIFKAYVFHRVIRKPEIQMIEYKGQQIVMELFQAFASDPQRLLPENTCQRWIEANNAGNGHRVIADYISGMTDGFASKLYSSLFMPSSAITRETIS